METKSSLGTKYCRGNCKINAKTEIVLLSFFICQCQILFIPLFLEKIQKEIQNLFSIHIYIQTKR